MLLLVSGEMNPAFACPLMRNTYRPRWEHLSKKGRVPIAEKDKHGLMSSRLTCQREVSRRHLILPGALLMGAFLAESGGWGGRFSTNRSVEMEPSDFARLLVLREVQTNHRTMEHRCAGEILLINNRKRGEKKG